MIFSIFLAIFIVSLPINVYAFDSVLSPNYNAADPNFNKLAMRAYNSNSPYFFTYGAYSYNALPITSTASNCKIVSVIRRTKGFPNPTYWAIENYKICSGNITEVENTNPAGWDNLPHGIKPVINNVVNEAKQYGKAEANYYGYRVVAKTGAYVNTVYIYVLNGIKLEAAMRF